MRAVVGTNFLQIALLYLLGYPREKLTVRMNKLS